MEVVVIKEFLCDRINARMSSNDRSTHDNPKNEIQNHAELEKGKFPYIVGFKDLFRDQKKLYIVMEFCEDHELGKQVAAEYGKYRHAIQGLRRNVDPHRKGVALSEEDAKRYFQQLISAVAYMHSHYIVHRDITLENILLRDEKKNLRLCDFGLSMKLLSLSQRLKVESNKYPPGRIDYMAPEIFAREHYSPFSADLFSCGVVLFIMLLGGKPFRWPNEDDVLFKHIADGRLEEYLKYNKVNEFISEEAKELLSGLITYEAKRLSLAEVITHPWLCGKPSSATSSSVLTDGQTPVVAKSDILIQAAADGRLGMIRHVFERYRCTVDWTPAALVAAVEANRVRVVKYLVEEARVRIDLMGKDWKSFSNIAVSHNARETVQFLNEHYKSKVLKAIERDLGKIKPLHKSIMRHVQLTGVPLYAINEEDKTEEYLTGVNIINEEDKTEEW
uniref:Protein kinase domain-containing protein n=1 Tax=Lotharella oceanica TaxID=641309 RepID=A0A7S2TFV1_9EUKA